MHEYYFKIKKGDIEFECSTSDKTTFEEQLSDWINGIVKGSYVAPPKNEETFAEPKDFEQNPQRSGFIDVKNLTSINEIQENDFNFDEKPVQEPEDASFEQALNESIQNPKTEVVEKVESMNGFEEFFGKYSAETPIDRLIVSALYVMNVENQERFTLKQINSKLVPVIGVPIDHSVVNEAIEQGYVKIMPDLTETSEFTEYTLTDSGEGYFVV